MRGLLHCQRPHKEEAEAAEMCEDIALTAREAVLQPGAPQHALLLQDHRGGVGAGRGPGLFDASQSRDHAYDARKLQG